MSIDRFLDRRYRRDRYNCLHHAAEVWCELIGEDIQARLEGVLNGVTRAHVAGFRRLPEPVNPCLVLMRRRSCNDMHVGVMVGGRVLHIRREGVEFQPLAVAACGFTDVRYYR